MRAVIATAFGGQVLEKLMTLTLQVTSYRGAPLPTPFIKRFEGQGGTIGRSPESDFVLPDQEKLISRTHATIKYRNDQYFIMDHGGNPLTIDGQPLGNGREAVLSDGNELGFGEYRVAVVMTAADAESSDSSQESSRSSASDEIFGAAMGTRNFTPDANDDGGYDPFAPDEILPLGNKERADRHGASASGSMRNDLPGFEEPLRPQTKPRITPTTLNPQEYDPWRDDFTTDQVPETQAGNDAPAVEQPTTALPSVDDILPVSILPTRGDAPPVPGEISSPSSQLNYAPRPVTPKPAQEASLQAGMPESRTALDSQHDPLQDAVLRALLKGLGMPHLTVPREQMERLAETLGEMLRESLEGTMELLNARATAKRENRMDQTLISTLDNNPLKFFPNVDEALITMLTRNTGAYLAPVPAVREAFEDMKAHELATVTGMRAAFGDMLQRFDPQTIEQQDQGGALDGVLPPLRKARLWERMNFRYQELKHESEDNFEKIFGASFARAYVDQVRRLRAMRDRDTNTK